MEHSAVILDALARATLASEAAEDAIVERCWTLLGRRWRWLRGLARRFAKFADGARPRRRDTVRFLREDRGLRRAWSLYGAELSVAQRLVAPQMLGSWNVPAIVTSGNLADWLAKRRSLG